MNGIGFWPLSKKEAQAFYEESRILVKDPGI